MKKYFIILLIIICIALFAVAEIYVDKTTKIYTGINEPAKVNNFKNYGMVPEFKSGDTWLNSNPLNWADLKGKVVLIDFWTYSCINCIRTLPYTTKWYDTYKNNGFVVIGVHTPEFAFEHDTNNVKNALSQFGIKYPVVQDNDYSIWNSYNNEYWPAEYLVNQKGEIIEENFGEGNYSETENNIRSLLGLNSNVSYQPQDLSKIASPEMYFGTDRIENLSHNQSISYDSKNYIIDNNLPLNQFSIGGDWKFSQTYLDLTGDNGEIDLHFHSSKLYIVASGTSSSTLNITIDGKQQQSVLVKDSKLYTLFDSSDYADHFAKIKIIGKDFKAFTFTFG